MYTQYKKVENNYIKEITDFIANLKLKTLLLVNNQISSITGLFHHLIKTLDKVSLEWFLYLGQQVAIDPKIF